MQFIKNTITNTLTDTWGIIAFALVATVMMLSSGVLIQLLEIGVIALIFGASVSWIHKKTSGLTNSLSSLTKKGK